MSIGFIGRKKELEQIGAFINSDDTTVLCIEGEGGIGKTRLLAEIQREYGASKHFQVLDIIDFDVPHFRLHGEIDREIAHQLSLLEPDLFQKYLYHSNDLEDDREKALSGQKEQAPSHEDEKQVDATFWVAYKQAAQQRRIVLRFDTTDNLKGITGPLDRIAQLVNQAPNTCILVAGRDATNLLGIIRIPQEEQESHTLNLEPLPKEDCKDYLDRKLEQEGFNIPRPIADKLLFLSGGRIILLDMSIEWLLRERVPEWLQKLDVEQLKEKGLDQDTREKFERRLFYHISELRTDVDRLILLLSKVSPLNRDDIQELLKITNEEIDNVWNHAQTMTFIKILPNDLVKLHDEAERLVNEYVWDLLDPLRAKLTSESAIEYLEADSDKLLGRIKSLEAADETIGVTEKRDIRYEFWIKRTQRLSHVLGLSVQKGYRVFEQDWKRAKEQFKQLNFQSMLLDAVLPYIENLEPEQQWEVMLRQARRLSDEDRQIDAVKDYYTLLEQVPDDSLYRVRALVGRGNAFVRLGKFRRAMKDGNNALRLAERLDDDRWMLNSELFLGWTHRLSGELERASNHYLNVIKRALESGDEEKTAKAQSNLAYVLALQGKQKQAVGLFEQAIETWRNLYHESEGYYEDLGRAYHRAGVVCRELGLVNQALNYFAQSWNIFAELDMEEWMANTRAAQGITYWMNNQYVEAADDIEWALKYGTQTYYCKIVHYLAHVKYNQGKFVEAERLFQEALQKAQEQGNAFYELNTLGDLARLAFEFKVEGLSTYQDFQDRLTKYKITYPAATFAVPLALLHIYLGHLAMKQGDFEKGIDYYEQGILSLADQDNISSYGQFDVQSQLRFIDESVVPLLSSEQVVRLGEKLVRATWLGMKHPEALAFLYRWRKGNNQSSQKEKNDD